MPVSKKIVGQIESNIFVTLWYKLLLNYQIYGNYVSTKTDKGILKCLTFIGPISPMKYFMTNSAALQHVNSKTVKIY